jgi:hypothetical protein
VIGVQIGIQQIDRDPANHHLPGTDVDRSPECLNRGQPGLVARSRNRHQWRGADIVLDVAVFLPAIQRQPLVEVALTVEESDANYRHAKITRRFAMVPGQHAQTARIDGHGCVQAELGTEVGDRAAVEVRIVSRKPGIAVIGLLRHAFHDVVIAAQELTVARAGRDARRVHAAEQLERVVPGVVPEGRVDGLEEVASLTIPAPPEVHRDSRKPFDAGWQVWNAGLLD